jgi:deoxyribose-phosphate aldolase
VIFETCLLTPEQIVDATILSVLAGAGFVKTCMIFLFLRLVLLSCSFLFLVVLSTATGFSTSGATVKDVRLMRLIVGDFCGVKASGGVRDLSTAQLMAGRHFLLTSLVF